MEKKKFSINARKKSFDYAFAGISALFKTEHNMLLHLVGTVVVIVLMFIVPVSTMEIIALILSIGFVWVAEIFNTAIEKIMDFITEERKPQIKLIKDLSAAGVLVAAIVALLVGCFVFIPKFL
jgi:diacylglycerol kinase (ATP)